MRVKAITSFSLGGGRDVADGEVFDLADEWNAKRLIAMGRFVRAWADPAPSPESGRLAVRPAVDEVSTREHEPEHREPRTRRAKGE